MQAGCVFYVNYIDFEKALDSVDRKILKHDGMAYQRNWSISLYVKLGTQYAVSMEG